MHKIRRTHVTESAHERTAHRHLRDLGYEFITHVALPGTPDIYIPDKRLVVQIFGCFLHRHADCPHCRTPKRFQSYWEQKFQATQQRDQSAQAALLRRGYRHLTLWTCALAYTLSDRLRPALTDFIEGTEFHLEIGRLDLLALPHLKQDDGRGEK